MPGLGFLSLFGITFGVFSCEGRIISPKEGEKYIFLPGRTGEVTWIFDDAVSNVRFRSWSFTNTTGHITNLGEIFKNQSATKAAPTLFDFDIVKPATLVLKNVDQRYNGIYTLTLITAPTGKSVTRDVKVFIAVKPNVALNCSSLVRLKEGDNFSCLCKGEGGNPPANVTWFKDGVKISDVGTENQTLKIWNAKITDDGTYKCVATSYSQKNYTDAESIEVIVNIKPNVTVYCSSSIIVNKGTDVTCKCKCKDGNPPANCTWYKDNEETGKTGKEKDTLNLPNIEKIDSGNYSCVGESYPTARDEKSIIVTVYYVTIEFSYSENNDNVTTTCTSNGPSLLDYTIYHNGTEAAKNMSYTISTKNGTYPGSYNCTAINKLGKLSAVKFLNANMGKPTPSIAPSTTTTRTVPSSTKTSSGGGTPGSASDNNTGLIVGLSLGGLAFIVIVCFLVYYCCTGTLSCRCGESSCCCGESSCCCGESSCRCGESSCCCGESSCRCGESSCCAALSCCCGDDERENDDKNPNGSRVMANHYELEEDHGEDAGAYDTVKQSDDGEGSQDKKKPAGDSLPPVYASVNKDNRQGNTLYASLDSEALRKPGSKKKQPETKNAPTEYASIDFMQTGKTPNADNA